MPEAVEEREALGHGDGHRCRTGCARPREALAEACRPCPEREGVLRRETLCRCPVALGLRLFHHVERHGPDPDVLSAGDRASLGFQERALARRLPPFDADAVRRSLDLLAGSGHDGCALAGCLQCRAARVLQSLVEIPVP